MRYFIGYVIKNPDSLVIDELRKKLAVTFSVQEALKSPPHLTLFYPFETDDIQGVEPALADIARSIPPFLLDVVGFRSFDEAVWFLDVEQRPELHALKTRIVDAITQTLGISENRKGNGVHFHITLAYKDLTPETFRQIESYLQETPLPVTHLTVSNITILRQTETSWVPLRVFLLGTASESSLDNPSILA
jgi:2'-5' RNA ligase